MSVIQIKNIKGRPEEEENRLIYKYSKEYFMFCEQAVNGRQYQENTEAEVIYIGTFRYLQMTNFLSIWAKRLEEYGEKYGLQWDGKVSHGNIRQKEKQRQFFCRCLSPFYSAACVGSLLSIALFGYNFSIIKILVVIAFT